MRVRKWSCRLLMISVLLLSACAGLTKMTPQERAMVFCDDFMTQYERWHSESTRIILSDKATAKTKILVATKINPKLNKLKPLITDYCWLAMDGKAPSSDTIQTIMADVAALFSEVGK